MRYPKRNYLIWDRFTGLIGPGQEKGRAGWNCHCQAVVEFGGRFLSGAKKGKVRPSVFFCPWQERRKNNLSIFINRYTVVWSKVQVCVAPGTAAILRDQGVTGQGGEKNRWKKTGTYRRPGVYAFTGE